MKAPTSIAALAASFMLTGCFQWEATRAVHKCGESVHSFEPKLVTTKETDGDGWSSQDIPFYYVKGVCFIERSYLVNGHFEDSGRICFFRTRADSFDQLLMAQHQLLYGAYSQTLPTTGAILWDYVTVDAKEALAVRSSNGYVLRISFQNSQADHSPASRKQNCRIMYKCMREDGGSWSVLAEAFPRGDQNDPPGKFMNENPLYKFVTGRHVFRDQPAYFHILKFPVYLLTVPFDFITTPCQALANIRVGP